MRLLRAAMTSGACPLLTALAGVNQTKSLKASINSNPDSATVSTGPPPDKQLQLMARFRALFKSEDIKSLALAITVTAVLFGLFFTFGTSNYETNDDTVMQGIASGFYSGHPDEHLVFTNVIIGRVLRFLYEAWPVHNWYRAYLIGAHFAALTAIAFVIFKRRRTLLFISLYAGFFFIVETRILLMLQFTTTAFIAGAAGLLLLVDALQPGRPISWPRVAAGLVFTTVMAMVREPVAPLLVLVSIPFLIERLGLSNWKRVAGVGIAAAVLCFAVTGFNRWYYQKDKAWLEFMEFNSVRGGFQGTPLAVSALRTAPRAGWSLNDVVMFKGFYDADPEVFGSVTRVRAFVEKAKALYEPQPHKVALTDFVLPNMFGRDSAALMELAFLNAVLCVWAAGVFRRRYVIALVASFAIFTALSYFLLSTARLPERVAYNMGLFANLICLYWASGFEIGPMPDISRSALSRWRDWVNANPTRGYRIILILIIVTCELGFISAKVAPQLAYLNSFNRRVKEISGQIFKPVQNLLPGGKPILVAMPHDSMLELCSIFYPEVRKTPFFLVPQGWLMQSPIFFQMLEQHGLVPYSLSLLDRRDVFFLMEDRWLQPLKSFYLEHYGLEISFTQILNTDADPEYAHCYLHIYQAHVIKRGNGPPPVSSGA